MAALPSTRRYGPDYTPPMVAAIASATAAIARLDARICVSPVAKAWAALGSCQGSVSSNTGAPG